MYRDISVVVTGQLLPWSSHK